MQKSPYKKNYVRDVNDDGKYLSDILDMIIAKELAGIDEFYKNTPGACPGEVDGHEDCHQFHDICFNFPSYFFSYFVDNPFDSLQFKDIKWHSFEYALTHPGIYQGSIDYKVEDHSFILLVYSNVVRVMGSSSGSMRFTDNLLSHSNFRYYMNKLRNGDINALKYIFQLKETYFKNITFIDERYYDMTEALHVDREIFNNKGY